MRSGPMPLGLWPLRGLWAALPLAAGGAISSALGDHSAPVRAVAAGGAWAAWAGVLLALLVPRSLSLTALRVGAPASVAAALWAAVDPGGGGTSTVSGWVGGLGVAWAAATMVLGLAAPVADALVDGSSYGPERRFALRTPAVLLFGPAPLAAVVAVAGVGAGPLLLGARAWAAGVVASVAGGLAAARAWRALHQLSRRWVVFVPAGAVLHDPVLLADPVLFRRQSVARLGPAAAGSEGTPGTTDVTGRAPGLVLELVLVAPVTVVLAERGPRRGGGRPTSTERLLLTPLRPGAVLAEASRRRLGTP